MQITKEMLNTEKDAAYIRGYMDAMALIEQTVKEQAEEKLMEITSDKFTVWCDYHSDCESCPYNDYDGDCEDKFIEDFKNGTLPVK